MAKIDFETVCPCGRELRGRMKKPTLLERSVAPIKCAGCGSRFLMTSVRIRGERGRLINTDIEILEVSKKAEEVIRSKQPGVIAAELAKVERFFGLKPELDPSKVIVETEMDE